MKKGKVLQKLCRSNLLQIYININISFIYNYVSTSSINKAVRPEIISLMLKFSVLLIHSFELPIRTFAKYCSINQQHYANFDSSKYPGNSIPKKIIKIIFLKYFFLNFVSNYSWVALEKVAVFLQPTTFERSANTYV